MIRTSFKEESGSVSQDMRYINVQKLLYIYMLGYPAHFGQLECLKLVSSPRFSDKKLGYLGIMLLLDESQEILTLVTNSLKNDMNNSNVHIIGIALCTLGNISSTEMSRDLCSEVEKLLNSSNAFVRKKAALCALRIIKKVPDLMENFLARAKALLNERNHAVLMTGVTLLTEMCKQDPSVLSSIKESIPVITRHLKNLVTAGFSPEHDVGGVTDPFLQVKLLRLLRILGKNDAAASEAMNDVLAQVASNTDGSKNVGNAILYETVLTIMETESDRSLRVLAVNILGKFLGNKDNNVRYVALTTLTKTAATSQMADASALQRHRATILECLRDADVTLRRNALDLSFHLVNPANIRILTRELLGFLEVAAEGSDVKSSTASRICEMAARHRPNARWEVDTVVRVLRVAGGWVDQSTVNHAVKLVSTVGGEHGGLQVYAVRKLFNVVRLEGERALVQEGLLQVMGWSVGEFGDVLVGGTDVGGGMTGGFSSSASASTGGDEDVEDSAGEMMAAPSEMEVVEIFDSVLRGPFATLSVKEYFMTALLKLLGRFHQPDVLDMIRAMIARYRTHQDAEIQARAIEYTEVSQLDKETRVALLERMPVLESALREESLKGSGSILPTSSPISKSPKRPSKAADDLLDLMFGENNAPASSPPTQKNENILDLLGGMGLGSANSSSTSASPAKTARTTDLLGDLFGSSSTSPTKSSTAPSMPTSLDDLFGTSTVSASTAATAATSPAAKTYTAYNKNGLCVLLTPVRDGASLLITSSFENTSSRELTGLVFQVAVTKALKLSMDPPSTVVIGAGQSGMQLLRIENPTKAPVKLRMKIGFTIDGQMTDEVCDFSGFDPSLWA